MVQICKCQICVQSTLHDIVQICKCQVILVSPSVSQSVSQSFWSVRHSGNSGLLLMYRCCVKLPSHKSCACKYFTPHITQICRCQICVKPPSQKSCASNHFTPLVKIHVEAALNRLKSPLKWCWQSQEISTSTCSQTMLSCFNIHILLWFAPKKIRYPKWMMQERVHNFEQCQPSWLSHLYFDWWPSYGANLQMSDLRAINPSWYCANLQVSDLWEANITQIYRIFGKSVRSESLQTCNLLHKKSTAVVCRCTDDSRFSRYFLLLSRAHCQLLWPTKSCASTYLASHVAQIYNCQICLKST
jgi:hypothetical protein